jgi:uncharacterized protein YjcR
MQVDCTEKCLARTRKGSPCQSPVVSGRNRCRMHGGAEGSGAPLNNQNAFKHGRYSAETIRARQKIQGLLRCTAEILKNL